MRANRRQISNPTLIVGSPADSPEWTALTVQSQSSQMIGSTVMLVAATAASTTMPVYGNASLPRMLVKKSFRPIVIAICQFFCPPSKHFGKSQVSAVIRNFHKRSLERPQVTASVPCAHCCSMVSNHLVQQHFNDGYHFHHCQACTKITCFHCLRRGGRGHEVSKCPVRCVCGYLFVEKDRKANTTMMSCACGVKICDGCHKKKEVCSCDVRGDSEDEVKSSSTLEEFSCAKIVRLIIEYLEERG